MFVSFKVLSCSLPILERKLLRSAIIHVAKVHLKVTGLPFNGYS
jgi:hypothetical protein